MMRVRAPWLAGLLLAPLMVLAAPPPSGNAVHGEHGGAATDAQQEYQAGMATMHDNMAKAFTSSDPDTAFIQGMIAHHEGAIAMARTQLKYGRNAEARKMAEAVIKAQQVEIVQMRQWLDKQASQGR